MHIGAFTDVGRVRQENEDAFHVDDHFFAVADGMGGHRAGKVASELALKTLVSSLALPVNDRDEIVRAFDEANRSVLDAAKRNPGWEGMGTTLTVVVCSEPDCHVVHVGDSRLYLLRDEDIKQLTCDHSLVGELVRSGAISRTEAIRHPQRHFLTQAIGTDGKIRPHAFSFSRIQGDRLILCTDGLHDLVEDREMLHTRNLAPQEACEALVSLANERGGHDNTTVIIVDL